MLTISLLLLIQQPIPTSLDQPTIAFLHALPVWESGRKSVKNLARLYRGEAGTTIILANGLVTKGMGLVGAGDMAGQIVVNGRLMSVGEGKGPAPKLTLVRLSVQQPDKPFDVSNRAWIWPPRGLSLTMRYLTTSEPFLQIDVVRELADRSTASLSFWRVTNLSTQPVLIGSFLVEDGSAGWTELGDAQWPVRPLIAEAPPVDAILPPRTMLTTPRYWYGTHPEVVESLYAPWLTNPHPTAAQQTLALEKVDSDQIATWQGIARKGSLNLKLSCRWPLDEDAVRALERVIGAVRPGILQLELSPAPQKWMGWEAWRQARFLLSYARKYGVDVTGIPVPPLSGAG